MHQVFDVVDAPVRLQPAQEVAAVGLVDPQLDRARAHDAAVRNLQQVVDRRARVADQAAADLDDDDGNRVRLCDDAEALLAVAQGRLAEAAFDGEADERRDRAQRVDLGRRPVAFAVALVEADRAELETRLDVA